MNSNNCNFTFCSQCFVKREYPHQMQYTALGLANTRDIQTQTCGDYVVRNFVQGLCRLYRNMMRTQQGACEFIFTHIEKTNLSCTCIACKQIAALFEDHSKKCQVPGCSIDECPLLKDLFDKGKALAARNTMTETFALQRLMEIQEAIKTAQSATTSTTAQDVTRPGILNRKFAIQRCIRTLEHAYRCTDVNCMPASCQKMKRVLAHIKVCKRKIGGGCIVCKQVCALCCYHAKTCNERKCTVLLCTYVKRRLRAINDTQKLAEYLKKRV